MLGLAANGISLPLMSLNSYNVNWGKNGLIFLKLVLSVSHNASSILSSINWESLFVESTEDLVLGPTFLSFFFFQLTLSLLYANEASSPLLLNY